MVTPPKLFTPAKIGVAFSDAHLFHQDINALRLHSGDKNERREKGITEENITLLKVVLNATQQGLLIPALSI